MEGLAVAASVAGILSLAGQTLKGIVKFRGLLKGIKGAKGNVESFLSDVESFASSISQVQQLLNQLPNNQPELTDKLELENLYRRLLDCSVEVNLWNKRGKELDPSSSNSIHAFFKRLKIVANNDGFIEFRRRIAQHQEKLGFSLSIIGKYLSIQGLSDLNGLAHQLENYGKTQGQQQINFTTILETTMTNHPTHSELSNIISEKIDPFKSWMDHEVSQPLIRKLEVVEESTRFTMEITKQDSESIKSLSDAVSSLSSQISRLSKIISISPSSNKLEGETDFATARVKEIGEQHYSCNSLTGIEDAFIDDRCIYCSKVFDSDWYVRGRHIVKSHNYAECELKVELTREEFNTHLEKNHKVFVKLLLPHLERFRTRMPSDEIRNGVRKPFWAAVELWDPKRHAGHESSSDGNSVSWDILRQLDSRFLETILEISRLDGPESQVHKLHLELCILRQEYSLHATIFPLDVFSARSRNYNDLSVSPLGSRIRTLMVQFNTFLPAHKSPLVVSQCWTILDICSRKSQNNVNDGAKIPLSVLEPSICSNVTFGLQYMKYTSEIKTVWSLILRSLSSYNENLDKILDSWPELRPPSWNDQKSQKATAALQYHIESTSMVSTRLDHWLLQSILESQTFTAIFIDQFWVPDCRWPHLIPSLLEYLSKWALTDASTLEYPKHQSKISSGDAIDSRGYRPYSGASLTDGITTHDRSCEWSCAIGTQQEFERSFKVWSDQPRIEPKWRCCLCLGTRRWDKTPEQYIPDECPQIYYTFDIPQLTFCMTASDIYGHLKTNHNLSTSCCTQIEHCDEDEFLNHLYHRHAACHQSVLRQNNVSQLFRVPVREDLLAFRNMFALPELQFDGRFARPTLEKSKANNSSKVEKHSVALEGRLSEVYQWNNTRDELQNLVSKMGSVYSTPFTDLRNISGLVEKLQDIYLGKVLDSEGNRFFVHSESVD